MAAARTLLALSALLAGCATVGGPGDGPLPASLKAAREQERAEDAKAPASRSRVPKERDEASLPASLRAAREQERLDAARGTTPAPYAFPPAPDEMTLDDVLVVTARSPLYPDGVAAQGQQGVVVLLLDLAADGHVTGASVHTSSRSPALDEAARQRALTMRFAGKGAPPARASLKVDFRRDTIDTIQVKTCAELDTDIAWQHAAFPERPATDVIALRLAVNMVMLNTVNFMHGEERGRVTRALQVALEATVKGCAERPDHRMKDVLNHALKQASDAGAASPAPSPAAAASRPVATARLPRTILHQARLDEPVWARAQRFTADMTDAYPPALSGRGLQGTIELQATVPPDGVARHVVVTRSSGSPELDAAAVARVQALKLPHGADEPDLDAHFDVEFVKDTNETIPRKRCGEFGTDLAAFARMHPGAPRGDYPAFALAHEILLEAAIRRSDSFEDLPKAWMDRDLLRAADDRAVAECAAHPASLFLDVYGRQVGMPPKAS